MLKHLCDVLKPGGMLVIVENCSIAHRDEGPAEQTKLHDIASEILERELVAGSLKVKAVSRSSTKVDAPAPTSTDGGPSV